MAASGIFVSNTDQTGRCRSRIDRTSLTSHICHKTLLFPYIFSELIHFDVSSRDLFY